MNLRTAFGVDLNLGWRTAGTSARRL